MLHGGGMAGADDMAEQPVRIAAPLSVRSSLLLIFFVLYTFEQIAGLRGAIAGSDSGKGDFSGFGCIRQQLHVHVDFISHDGGSPL
ncbi:hypothetical protein D3C81_1888750 [compost metagenome]